MNDSESIHNTRAGNSGNVTLFLGLFLLLLAFFIMLMSMSNFEETKSQRVMESLTATFSDLTTPVTNPASFLSKSGDTLSPEAFQQLMSGVFSAAVAVDRTEIIQPGRAMRVDLRANELFVVNKSVIRDTRLDLIDRIASSLGASPEGYRFEISFLIGVSLSHEGTMPVEQTLEARRAGSFARTAIAHGAPPASVSVGIASGNPKEVSIYFYVREEESERLQLGLPAVGNSTYDDTDADESEAIKEVPSVPADSGASISLPLAPGVTEQ